MIFTWRRATLSFMIVKLKVRFGEQFWSISAQESGRLLHPDLHAGRIKQEARPRVSITSISNQVRTGLVTTPNVFRGLSILHSCTKYLLRLHPLWMSSLVPSATLLPPPWGWMHFKDPRWTREPGPFKLVEPEKQTNRTSENMIFNGALLKLEPNYIIRENLRGKLATKVNFNKKTSFTMQFLS